MRPTYSFPEAAIETIARERYQHPDPRVQQRMEILWLKSKNRDHGDIRSEEHTSELQSL